MYLSLLRLNPRSRKAMTETIRPYELHRSVMRAFPGPESGGAGRVLYRLDIDDRSDSPAVLVQSEKRPDWGSLEKHPDFLLEIPQKKEYSPTVAEGQTLYFRIRANPTVKREGKRAGLLKEPEQIAWLRRKATDGGFEVLSLTVTPEGKFTDSSTDNYGKTHNFTFLSVRFEGVLRVLDPVKFGLTLERGIGSAKGLGFGLLSIAPLKSE